MLIELSRCFSSYMPLDFIKVKLWNLYELQFYNVFFTSVGIYAFSFCNSFLVCGKFKFWRWNWVTQLTAKTKHVIYLCMVVVGIWRWLETIFEAECCDTFVHFFNKFIKWFWVMLLIILATLCILLLLFQSKFTCFWVIIILYHFLPCWFIISLVLVILLKIRIRPNHYIWIKFILVRC